MTIKELAEAVHSNAVAHGWWEEKRSCAHVLALIHSEWSEALEEGRAGRPMIYYACTAGLDYIDCDGHPSYEMNGICTESVYKKCKYRGAKPEGIAVELIDGCIRILDFLGETEAISAEIDGPIEELYDQCQPTGGESLKPADQLPELIARLHYYTAEEKLIFAMSQALCYVRRNGLDPLEVLLTKHEYNKTRPYKHGKRF